MRGSEGMGMGGPVTGVAYAASRAVAGNDSQASTLSRHRTGSVA